MAFLLAGSALGFWLEDSPASSSPTNSLPLSAHSASGPDDTFLGDLGTVNAVEGSDPVFACLVYGNPVGCHKEWVRDPQVWHPPPWQ